MTEFITTNYTTPGNHNLRVPSRKELHRYFPNNITINDFNTGCASGIQVNKVANAINKTLKSKEKKGK